jgi:hypothetical protein
VVTPNATLRYNTHPLAELGREYVQSLALPVVHMSFVSVAVAVVDTSEQQTTSNVFVVGETLVVEHLLAVKGRSDLRMQLRPPPFLALLPSKTTVSVGDTVARVGGTIVPTVDGWGNVEVDVGSLANLVFGGGSSEASTVTLTTVWYIADVAAASDHVNGTLAGTVLFANHERTIDLDLFITEPLLAVAAAGEQPAADLVWSTGPVDAPSKYTSALFTFRIEHVLLSRQLVPAMQLAVRFNVTGSNSTSDADLVADVAGSRRVLLPANASYQVPFQSRSYGEDEYLLAADLRPLDSVDGQIRVQYLSNGTLPKHACLTVTAAWSSKEDGVGFSEAFARPQSASFTTCYKMPQRVELGLSAAAVGAIVGAVGILLVLAAVLVVVLLTRVRSEKPDSQDALRTEALRNKGFSFGADVYGDADDGKYGVGHGHALPFHGEYSDVADVAARAAVHEEYDDVADTATYGNRGGRRASQNIYGLGSTAHPDRKVSGALRGAGGDGDDSDSDLYGLRDESSVYKLSRKGEESDTYENSVGVKCRRKGDEEDVYDNGRGVRARRHPPHRNGGRAVSQIYGLGGDDGGGGATHTDTIDGTSPLHTPIPSRPPSVDGAPDGKLADGGLNEGSDAQPNESAGHQRPTVGGEPPLQRSSPSVSEPLTPSMVLGANHRRGVSVNWGGDGLGPRAAEGIYGEGTSFKVAKLDATKASTKPANSGGEEEVESIERTGYEDDGTGGVEMYQDPAELRHPELPLDPPSPVEGAQGFGGGGGFGTGGRADIYVDPNTIRFAGDSVASTLRGAEDHRGNQTTGPYLDPTAVMASFSAAPGGGGVSLTTQVEEEDMYLDPATLAPGHRNYPGGGAADGEEGDMYLDPATLAPGHRNYPGGGAADGEDGDMYLDPATLAPGHRTYLEGGCGRDDDGVGASVAEDLYVDPATITTDSLLRPATSPFVAGSSDVWARSMAPLAADCGDSDDDIYGGAVWEPSSARAPPPPRRSRPQLAPDESDASESDDGTASPSGRLGGARPQSVARPTVWKFEEML